MNLVKGGLRRPDPLREMGTIKDLGGCRYCSFGEALAVAQRRRDSLKSLALVCVEPLCRTRPILHAGRKRGQTVTGVVHSGKNSATPPRPSGFPFISCHTRG